MNTPLSNNNEELREEISKLVDRAKGYGYPMTTIEAVKSIMNLISEDRKAREAEIRIDERKWYDDRLTDAINNEAQDWNALGDEFAERLAELQAPRRQE